MTKRFIWEETLETLVATFGGAKLVRTIQGRFELRGGTRNDLIEAREWAAMFMPEVTMQKKDGRRQARTPAAGQCRRTFYATVISLLR